MNQTGTSRITVFIALAVGFLVLGLSCSYILFTGSREAFFDQVRSNLKSTADLASIQINPQAIVNLNEPDQTDTSEFKEETDRLEQIVASANQVSHISVLKTIGPQYHFVVDASIRGKDQSKSELLDPADEIPTELTRAVTERKAVVTQEPITDRWGTWYSAYSPIFDQSSKVVGVVAVDADAADIEHGDRDLLLKYQTTLAVVIAVCLAMAWLASGPVSQSVRSTQIWNGSPQRRAATEIIMVIVILGLFFQGAQAFLRNKKLQAIQSQISVNQSILKSISAAETTLVNGGLPHQNQLNSLKQTLAVNDLGVLADNLDNAVLNRDSQSLKALNSSITSLRERQSLAIQDSAVIQELGTNASIRLFIGLLLLSISTVALVRYSANQDQRISQSKLNSSAMQAQMSSLVENLPVGLFVIEKGAIAFANTEWKSQVGIPTGQSELSPQFLADAIFPDDRERTLADLTAAVNQARPFQIQYRIVSPQKELRHVETRGVPVYDEDGICRRILAFTVDLTATVEAKSQLETAYGEVHHKNKLLANALAELEMNLEGVVRSLVKAVEAKDPYTAGHSERVMQYSLWLGDAIGLGPYERRILELGTLVHDVGKIGIPDAILTKPDRLTAAEYDIIKKHPEYGVNIIGDIEMFRECLPIVRWHHERLDGRGYPDSLKGEEIPLLVRISAIADIFDAMTSTRAYRKGMDLDKVLEVMSEISEKGEIDSELFATFCQVIHEKGIIQQTVQQEPWKAA